MARTARKWSGKVKTVSTDPPQGLFTKDPATIARTLASKRGLTQRSGIGNENAHLFHQSSREESERPEKSEIGKGKNAVERARRSRS